MKILIAGDYCDRYRVTDCIRNKEYAKMFDGIKHLVHSFDFAVLNFEFPIVKTKGFPIVKSGPNLKGQPSSIDAIKYAGFNVCTLANNHILDQGEQCCLDTENLLEKAGIKTVGIGNNLKEASNILYLSKDGLVLAIVNCAEHEFSYATENSAGANPINPIRQYHQIQEAKRSLNYDEYRKMFSKYEFNVLAYKSDEDIRKDNEKDAKGMVMNLYNRIKDITGEITDWSGITLAPGARGSATLNGVVIGNKGKCKVESIYAEGPVQRLHVRVLTKEIN